MGRGRGGRFHMSNKLPVWCWHGWSGDHAWSVRIYNERTHTASLWPRRDEDVGLLTLPLVLFPQYCMDFNKITVKFIIQTKFCFVFFFFFNVKRGTVNNHRRKTGPSKANRDLTVTRAFAEVQIASNEQIIHRLFQTYLEEVQSKSKSIRFTVAGDVWKGK